MGLLDGIHWKAPVTMFAAWLTGIGLVCGHHFFNLRLDGKDVLTTYIESHGVVKFNVSIQGINTSVGTALAFLVKTCFALAASIAYIQIIWHSIKRKKARLSIVDSAFSASNDFSAFLSLKLWGNLPLVTLLALSLFLIPIPSVITPASLSIKLAPINEWHLSMVPFVDFTSLNFASIMNRSGLTRNFTYRGPQYSVQEVVTASCADGSILPIEPMGSNVSWSLKFDGPAIQCSAVSPTEEATILENIGEYMMADKCLTSFGYISWTPDDSGSVPFYKGSPKSSYVLRSSTLSTAAPGQLKTYLATFHNMTNMVHSRYCDDNEQAEFLANPTIISCGLYNTTYEASFSYLNGRQNISVTSFGYHNDIYAAPALGGSTLGFNKTSIQNYAYQAVWDAFGRILVGTIYSSTVADNGGAIITINTTIMASALSNTKELAFLGDWNSQYSSKALYSLQQALLAGSEYQSLADYNGTWILKAPASTASLATALEESFGKATISLMSSSVLQPNYTSPYAPPKTNVTTQTWRNIYVYSPALLWFPYGFSIALATVAVILGTFCLISNEASFSANFSTILRVSHEASLNEPVRDADADGRDPLPEHLAKAELSFPSSGTGDETVYTSLEETTK